MRSPVTRPSLDYRATVPGLLAHAVAEFGHRECVVTPDERVSYAEIDERSRRLARRMVAWGVGKGTRVATQFPYGVEWLVSWLAVSRTGALHLPFSTAYKPAELRKSLRHGDVALLLAPSALFGADHGSFVAQAIAPLVAGDGRQPPAPELPYLRDVWFGVDGDDDSSTDAVIDAMAAEIAPADLAVAIFTSGTTSEPKGVLHTHGALVRKGAHLAALQEWTVDDRIFCGMPFFWVGGLAMTVVPAFHVGATLLCVDRTDPDRSLDLVRREKATKLTGWPGVIGPILAAATEDDAAVPALGQHFAIVGARHSSLGMTETLASYTYATPEEQAIPLPEGRTGSMGWLVDGAEVKIVDPVTQEHLPDGVEGVILVRGYFLTAGIVKHERSEVFTPDGFYNTGDKGSLVGDQLFLTGRVTEVIKTSGNNVAPPEIEMVLRSMPEIKDAHVLGVRDSERGEIVAAFVVPAAGAVLDVEVIRERCREVLSNFKVPRLVVVADEDDVPWLATGKPDRLHIKAMLAEAAARTP